MLRLFERDSVCNRRELLSIGALGLGGLTLASLLNRQAWASDSASALTGKSVIFLFQQGGPSQLETFDPKPDAPTGTRTVTGVTRTSIPGVQFGSTMSQLAKLADKLTVVRSFQTGNAGHNIKPIVSSHSNDANIGAHYARVAGATNAATGSPTTAVLYPAAVDPEAPPPQARGDLLATGNYGASYAPFVPGAGGQLQQDMQLTLDRDRFLNDRRAVLQGLDRLSRAADINGQLEATDDIRRQAYQVLLGDGVRSALDLSLEDRATLAMYDTGPISKPGAWNHVRRGTAGYYDSQSRNIGKLLLMARRLCEAGCGFVTIHAGYAGVWDMHADGNNLNMTDGMNAVGRSFDHAVAAFIRDLESRGLQDQIMLVTTGEMGRTPRINKRGGRDHWSRLAPLLIYGGGAPAGKIVGQSTRDAGEPATDAVGPAHLISTILRTVIDPAVLRLFPEFPDAIGKLANHDPIV